MVCVACGLPPATKYSEDVELFLEQAVIAVGGTGWGHAACIVVRCQVVHELFFTHDSGRPGGDPVGLDGGAGGGWAGTEGQGNIGWGEERTARVCGNGGHVLAFSADLRMADVRVRLSSVHVTIDKACDVHCTLSS